MGLPILGPLLQAIIDGSSQQGQTGQSPMQVLNAMPGQEARLGQQGDDTMGQISGATGQASKQLTNQLSQQDQGALPASAGALAQSDGTPANPAFNGPIGGVDDPSTWGSPIPSGGGGMSVNTGGGAQATPGLSPMKEPSAQQPSSVPWSDLFNIQGNNSNPNILTRGGFGYNKGGLLGALGLMLTNMNTQPQQPQQPQQQPPQYY